MRCMNTPSPAPSSLHPPRRSAWSRLCRICALGWLLAAWALQQGVNAAPAAPNTAPSKAQAFGPLISAQALAAQTVDAELQAQFAPLAAALAANEAKIVTELNEVQGNVVDMGGYYHADVALTGQAMRPSATFNAALAAL